MKSENRPPKKIDTIILIQYNLWIFSKTRPEYMPEIYVMPALSCVEMIYWRIRFDWSDRTRLLRIAFNERKLDYLIVVPKVLDLNGAQHACRLYK